LDSFTGCLFGALILFRLRRVRASETINPPFGVARARSRIKVRDVTRRLVDDGRVKVSQKGSHRQFNHPTKPGKVTVPGKPSDDLAEGTYRSILRQAGLQE
jgi:predicted RNA binding protein YcfA (HicA-like mRNA interferase family)